MNANDAVPMPYNVAPGQTVDVSVNMAAPDTAGHYEGIWQLRSPDGKTFGVGPRGTDNVWVRIRVIEPAYSTATAQPGNPTQTVAITPSALASPTAPPVSTPTLGSEARYDFASNVCAAQWQSNTGVLPCPGTDGSAKGFVLRLDHAQLEDGTTTALPAILTFPLDAADGYILGVYPDYDVQSGDHLQASVGCEYGATACSVLFRVSYLDPASSPHDLWTLGEFYDGKHFNLDLDLSQAAGQKVKFVLYVGSLGSATGDRALWVAPRVVHFPAAPTVTDTLTPTAPPTATPSLEPIASAVPTLVPVAPATAVPTPASQPSSAQQILDAIISFFQHLFGGK